MTIFNDASWRRKQVLSEMEMNDPLLIAIRARKQDIAKAKAAPKVKKISTKQYYKLMDAEIDLINQIKDATKDIDIRRYITWKKIVKGKPIYIRLYELVYYELLIIWLEMGRPPIRSAIYEMINRKEFDESFIKGKKIQQYIDEVIDNQCEDGSGYYISSSNEILTKKDIKNLYKIKHTIKNELSKKNKVHRYHSIFVFCKIYESWALLKKDKQIRDVTKKERFDVTPDLPLKITIAVNT